MAERRAKGWQAPDYVNGIIGSIYGRNIGAMMKCEMIGDWKAFSSIIDKLPRHVQNSAYATMVSFGSTYLKALKRGILTNGSSIGAKWPALDEKYARSKKGNRDQQYINSKVLYNNLIMERDAIRHKVVVTVRQDDQTISKGGMSASQVAHVLEIGSYKHSNKPRPLFGPAWRSIGGKKALTEATTINMRAAINELGRHA
jgi:hypothetical protein